jgi:hypothetical protein
MTVDAEPQNPLQISAADRDAIERQLERMLADRHFSHSRRFPAFLRFVVQKTLAGSTDQLKERTLGVEIFGRSPEYDTSSDPIVRVTAAEIRKRIAQYYQEKGRDGELRISLEAGSYIPQFYWAHGAQAVPASVAAEWNGGHTPVSDAEEKSNRGLRQWLIPAILIAVLVAAGLNFAWRSTQSSPVDFFWGPITSHGEPALFCVADQDQYNTVALRDAADPTRQTMIQDTVKAVIIDDLNTIVKIAGILQSHGKKYTLKGEGSTTLTDLRNGPTVFIGAFDNAWTLRVTQHLRFHFGNDPDFRRQWIADGNSTQPSKWMIERQEPVTTNNYREYGLVARFTDPTTGQLSVVAAGIGRGGTIAAGEFLTDPVYLAQLERISRTAEGKKNIEVVISTQIIDNQPGTPNIEATYFW